MTAADAMLAEQLLAQGLAYWASFAQRKAAGELTQADLEAASAKLDADIDILDADVRAQSAAAPQAPALE